MLLASVALGCGTDAPLPGEAPAQDSPAATTQDTAPRADTAPVQPGPAVGSNVLFILTDDQGVDKVAAYGEHHDPPRTPVIDSLAAEGVLFRRAYGHPVCSPTRASILTGRYNDRYGLGDVIHPSETSYALRDREISLPEALSGAGYASAALGKWHLAGFSSTHETEHPLVAGFQHYAGAYGNLLDEKAGTSTGMGLSYYWWQKNTNGDLAHVHRFATSDTTDDAIAQMALLPEPWFLFVTFNAPHTPLDLAPEDLHEVDFDMASPPEVKLAALVESMDSEIGRMLDSMGAALRARTTVVFMSDNGTYGDAMIPPWRGSHGKNTPYEGGIRVPLIVSGPAVVDPGREVDALVHAVDIFPTITDLAGVDLTQVLDWQGQPVVLDGISIFPYLQDPATPPLRQYVYTGKFGPNGAPSAYTGVYAYDWDIVLDERWKYIRGYAGEELYDLENPGTEDGMEGDNLLSEPLGPEAQEAYDRLVAELQAIEARAPYEPLE